MVFYVIDGLDSIYREFLAYNTVKDRVGYLPKAPRGFSISAEEAGGQVEEARY